VEADNENARSLSRFLRYWRLPHPLRPPANVPVARACLGRQARPEGLIVFSGFVTGADVSGQ